MMKKLTAILLALTLTLSCFALSASAAQGQTAAEEKIAQATAVALEAVLGDGAKVVDIDKNLTEAIIAQNGTDVTVKELADAVSNLVLVKESDLEQSDAAKAIADDCSYKAVTLKDGKKTVYIVLDLSKHPELFDIDVFHDSVVAMGDRQSEYVTEGDEFTLMDYNRIAGELALHMIVYKALKPFYNPNGLSVINKIYEDARICTIDVTEKRAPASLMTAIGFVFMRILYAIKNIGK